MTILERVIAKAGVLAADSAVQALERSAKRTVEFHVNDLRRIGLAPPAEMERVIAEELRVIKRPLLVNAEGGDARLPNGNIIMIGSALPGAGKTFLSLNLAMSMASELDWTVLLVDADVSRATLSRSLGLGDAPGLIGVLEHAHADLGDYVFKTNHRGLHILPAGSPSPQAKDLLGSQRMRAIVADLGQREARRIVVFDSPPLLLTSEARVLASYVGQIVLVVEAGVTPRRSLLEAIEILDSSKAVNLVLNKGRKLFGSGYHRYSYGDYGAFDNKS